MGRGLSARRIEETVEAQMADLVTRKIEIIRLTPTAERQPVVGWGLVTTSRITEHAT